MSSYCHTQEYTLRYSDFDFKDELRLSSLLALTQEVACSSADELGFGYDDLKPQNYGFIIVNTYCEFVSPVHLGDSLVVETWPLPPRHVIFERDYRVKNGKGETVANLASRWCLVDLKSFALLTPEALQEAHTRCPYRAEKTVEVPSWKIPKLGDEGAEIYRMTVKNSRCDHYFHANNANYADFFLDAFTMDELSNRRIKAFQIAYAKQAKENTELAIFRKETEDGAILEARAEGEVLTQMRLWYDSTDGNEGRKFS